MRNRLESLILVFLILLSGYQTYKLWFDGTLNHNFFSVEKNEVRVDWEYYSKPRKMIVSQGNNKLLLIKNTMQIAGDLEKMYKEDLKNVLEKGQYKEKVNINIKEVLEDKALLVTYNTLIDIDTFIKELSVDTNKTYRKIEPFNKVIIAKKDTHKLVYFYNDEIGISNIVKIDNTNELFELVDNVRDFESRIVLNETNRHFKTNIFIPFFEENKYSYRDFEFTDPIVSDNDLDQLINKYFENPAIKWREEKDEDYILFGDDKTTIKYYKNRGLLTYEKKVTEKNSSLSLIEAYQLAWNFINLDNKSSKEIYLKSYEKKNEKYIFKFNYEIDGYFPYIFDKAKFSQVDSAIEVVIEDREVIEYKRLLKAIKKDSSELKEVELIPYTKALDKIFDRIKNEKIEDIEIGYYQIAEELKLVWIISLEDNTILVDAKEGEEDGLE